MICVLEKLLELGATYNHHRISDVVCMNTFHNLWTWLGRRRVGNRKLYGCSGSELNLLDV